MGSEMKQTTADACVVEMRHISKVFPGVKALEDVVLTSVPEKYMC